MLKGVSDERFDECAEIGLEALQDDARLTPASAMFTARNFGVIAESVAAELWESPGMSPEEAVDLLREELEVSRELTLTP